MKKGIVPCERSFGREAVVVGLLTVRETHYNIAGEGLKSVEASRFGVELFHRDSEG